MHKDMNEVIENLPTYAGIALGIYTTLLFGAQAVQDLATKKITSQEQLEMSVLGRDITDLFALIVDRPRDLVCLIGQRHSYNIVIT